MSEATLARQFVTFLQFSKEQCADVVAAVSTFAICECRNSLPAAITQTFGTVSQCCAAADLDIALSANIKGLSEQLAYTVAAGGDSTKDKVYRAWLMNISDEATYLAAYKN